MTEEQQNASGKKAKTDREWEMEAMATRLKLAMQENRMSVETFSQKMRIDDSSVYRWLNEGWPTTWGRCSQMSCNLLKLLGKFEFFVLAKTACFSVA